MPIEGLDELRRGEILRSHEVIQATVPDCEPLLDSGMVRYGRSRDASGRGGEASVVGGSSRGQYEVVRAAAAADPVGAA